MTELISFLHNAQKERCLEPGPDKGLNFMMMAAKEGNLMALVYGHNRGFETSEYVCQMAARAKSLDCLKFLREIVGATWHQGTLQAAASSGSLACLKYAHRNGLVIDVKALTLAARKKNADCFQYLLDHGQFTDAEVDTVLQKFNMYTEIQKY